MGKVLVLIGLCLFSLPVQSQEGQPNHEIQPARNVIYASFGGAGIYYSLNYERRFVNKGKFIAAARVGFGTDFSPALFGKDFSIPVGGYFLYGKKKGHLELGLNLSNYFFDQYDYTEQKSTTVYRALLVPSIAYRYQKKSGGLMARIGFSPVFNLSNGSNAPMPWIDLGFGWAF